MRPYHAAALVLSLVAAVSSASADDSPKPKKPKTTASAKAPKKVASAASTKKKKPTKVVAPAPEPAPEAEAEAEEAPEPTFNAPADASKPSSSASHAPSLPKPGDAPVDADHASDEPSPPRPFSVAPLLGISTGELHFGVGVRAGYTLPSHVYLGAGFMYQFGSGLALGGASIHSFYPSIEGGYDIKAGPVIIRPYAGIAVNFRTESFDGLLKTASVTTQTVGIYPGCALAYDIPRSSFFVGGDARLMFDFDYGTSFALSGSGGMRF